MPLFATCVFRVEERGGSASQSQSIGLFPVGSRVKERQAWTSFSGALLPNQFSLSLCHTLIGGGNFLHFFFLLCEITNPFVCHIPRLSCAPKSGFSLSFPHHVGFRRWRWRPSGKASLRRRLTAKKRRPCTCLGRKPSSLRCSRRS